MKKVIVFIAIILVAILGIITFSIILKNDNNSNKVNFYFFPLQDADASLITYKETIIMIDTGEEKDQEKIQKKLQDKKIPKIDYLILTHPDKDHIGNAQFLIENYQIGTIFQTDYDKESKLQDDLNEIIEKKEIQNEIVTEETELQIEDLRIKIQPPSKQYEDSNNNSLIVTIAYNGRKALYAGDIREERIQEILQDLEEVDLLKYPYHGRKNELSKEFIQKIKPKMTIITGENPDEDIINELKNVGSEIRITSERQVEIIFE